MNAAFALPAVRPGAPPVDFVLARQHMMDGQIKPNNIIQPAVVAALAATPREAYVQPEQQDRAYGDRCLQWEGAFAMPPLACAKVLEVLAPIHAAHVLVIESGSGYLAALAAQVVQKVTVLFSDVGQAKVALNNFTKSGYTNITAKSGLLARGWQRNAPYDAIILAGASYTIPDTWQEQLTQQGHVIGAMPDADGIVRLYHYSRHFGHLSGRTVVDMDVPFLPGLSPPAKFKF